MSANTKIEWADHTFNPWIGCTKVGPGCDHCYAEQRMDKRLHVVHWGAGQDRKRTSAENWKQPLRWNKQAGILQHAWQLGVELHGGNEAACIAAGFLKPVRPRVFCASLADVFDNAVDPQWRADLFALIEATPNIDWLLLTKRVGNVRGMLALIPGWHPKPNVSLGITVVNQEEADRDIRKLLAIPAAKRFLSMEPLLGLVNLTSMFAANALHQIDGGPQLDWVIVGGESGPNARPMHPDWARSLRDQCQAAGVPFLFKQWGEWVEVGHESNPHGPPLSRWMWEDGKVFEADDRDREMALFCKVGKKAAGRLLDGRTWDEVPA